MGEVANAQISKVTIGRPLLRTAFAVACSALSFVAALGFTAWGLGALLPDPVVPPVSPKLGHLSKYIGDYDAIFIGSSRINFQILPSQFDARLAADGLRLRSFNCGVPGMFPPEDSYVLDQILAMRPLRLRWIFIEANYLTGIGKRGLDSTKRQLYWRDWTRTRLMNRSVLALPSKPARKADQTLAKRWVLVRKKLDGLEENTALFLQNALCLGRGSEILESRTALKPAVIEDLSALGKAGDGWVRNQSRVMQGEELGEFERAIAARAVKPAEPKEMDAVSQESLASMLAKIEKAGALPVIVIPPTTLARYLYPKPELAARYPILDFSDVRRYPALYARENRLDAGHVNTAGAEIFTRLLAERFLGEVHQSH